MSLRINTNVDALNGWRQMVKNQGMLSTSLQRLSSGLKINSAADSPAGLIISQNLAAQLAGISTAMDNTNQAINMVQTAEGAMDEMNTLLVKAKSLALSSASDATADTAQQTANDTEFQNIIKSLARIASNTQYAQNGLLSGKFSAGKTVMAGAFGSQSVKISIANILSKISGYLSGAISVATKSGAAQALSAVSKLFSIINTQRGNLGAVQTNTLQSNLNSLQAAYQNLSAARSTITDVDFAQESANYTKYQILMQSSTAMLAQANQLPQGVLKLLG
jgi:flagellin